MEIIKPYLNLTKRELYAAMAMQGMASNSAWIDSFNKDAIQEIATKARLLADELLKALEEK
jgi:hypothetical protein